MALAQFGTSVALSIILSVTNSFANDKDLIRINQLQLIGTHNSYHIALPEKNLKRIGLLTDKVLPLYEKLNLTSYMDADSEFEIDWAELNKPLESSKEIDLQSEKELAAHAAQGLF